MAVSRMLPIFGEPMGKLASILIPVFNDEEDLERVLSALNEQTLDAGKFEIIVVDNGSDNPPRHLVESMGGIFLSETRHFCSPYSARNRGAERATGEVLVFLDATCLPAMDWLEQGLEAVTDGNPLVAGEVLFDVNKESSAAEIYDSSTNINMRKSVCERGVAKTANLFVRASLFRSAGPFREGVRSGEDVRWTGAVVTQGVPLIFCEKAVVWKKARTFRELVGKQWRVAKGQPAIWRANSEFMRNFIKKVLLCFIPPDPRPLRRVLERLGLPTFGVKFFQLFGLGYLLRVVNGVSSLASIVGLQRG